MSLCFRKPACTAPSTFAWPEDWCVDCHFPGVNHWPEFLPSSNQLWMLLWWHFVSDLCTAWWEWNW
jgi:hypothetical protein